MNSNKYACCHTNTPTHNFTYAELYPRQQTKKYTHKICKHTHTFSVSQDSVSAWNPLPTAWLRQPYAAAGPIVQRRCGGRRKRWGFDGGRQERRRHSASFHSYNKRRGGGVRGETGEKAKKDKEEEATDRRNKRKMTGRDKRIGEKAEGGGGGRKKTRLREAKTKGRPLKFRPQQPCW